MNLRILITVIAVSAISAVVSAQITTAQGWGEQERDVKFGTTLGGVINPGSITLDDSDMRLKGYLFSQFTDAKVKFINGDVIVAKMNYFLGGERMHFVDSKGAIQELGNYQSVEFVLLKNRVFVFDDEGLAKERISVSPEVYASYSCDMKYRGSVRANYRDQNSTSNYGFHNITTRDDIYYGSDSNENVNITYAKLRFGETHCTYRVVVKGELKKFKDLKGFVKLFDKSHRKQIEKFAAVRNTNFSYPTQVAEICAFAAGL